MNQLVNITVEVHCIRPQWAVNHDTKEYRDSRYRVYVDDDLITERTWVWDNSTFLEENLWVNLDSPKVHTLKLEPIRYTPEQAEFSLMNFKVVNMPATIVSSDVTELSFALA